MTLKNNWKATIYACYLGYIVQAIVNNFAPLLFVELMKEYGFTLSQMAMITTLNFSIQLLTDLLSAKFIDHIGYRKAMLMASGCAMLGLISLAFLPEMVNPWAGIFISVILYAIGGGIVEVLISPIVEACPTDDKEGAMSMLHSFYCWGHLGVVLLSTLFFHFAGIQNWRTLALLWALVPVACFCMFLHVPIQKTISDEKKMPVRNLIAMPLFWLIFILMICSGASEQAMSQWASTFAEKGLGVSKELGDLLGVSMFALTMGISRAYYGKHSAKMPLRRTMVFSAIACITCYLLASLSPSPYIALAGCALTGMSVGIFWPGTFSIASASIPEGGTALFALLALGGDIGCTLGPTIAGNIADQTGSLQSGLLWSILFPLIQLFCLFILPKKQKS